jgi:hypothetical protein
VAWTHSEEVNDALLKFLRKAGSGTEGATREKAVA